MRSAGVVLGLAFGVVGAGLDVEDGVDGDEDGDAWPVVAGGCPVSAV